MEQIALCYQAAAALLTAAAQSLGHASLPAAIPLRLRADTGTLVSGLAPALTGRGDADALAQELADRLFLAGTPFDRAEARAGLVLLHISPHWLREATEALAAGPLPSPPPIPSGPRNRNVPIFLFSYTVRRCRALAERPAPQVEELPPAVVLRLASPLGDRAAEGRLLRAYWALPPEVRRDSALSGAVCRRAGADYDRFFR